MFLITIVQMHCSSVKKDLVKIIKYTCIEHVYKKSLYLFLHFNTCTCNLHVFYYLSRVVFQTNLYLKAQYWNCLSLCKMFCFIVLNMWNLNLADMCNYTSIFIKIIYLVNVIIGPAENNLKGAHGVCFVLKSSKELLLLFTDLRRLDPL